MQRNTVAYDEGQQVELARKLLLQDAISDLPSVCFIFIVIFYCFVNLFNFLLYISKFSLLKLG